MQKRFWLLSEKHLLPPSWIRELVFCVFCDVFESSTMFLFLSSVFVCMYGGLKNTEQGLDSVGETVLNIECVIPLW